MTDPLDDLFSSEDPTVARILRVARQQLFAHGYNAVTMAALAHELGMSKKTLYVHFASKDALLERIIDFIGRSVRARMDALLSDAALGFPQRVTAIVEVAGSTMTRISPDLLRELQRFAPRIYQKLDDLRQKNIPYVFGRLIRDGIADGHVRAGVDPAFATEFWLQAVRGLMHPDVMARTGLSPRQTLENALNLFLSGLLTPAGRKNYEKHLAS